MTYLLKFFLLTVAILLLRPAYYSFHSTKPSQFKEYTLQEEIAETRDTLNCTNERLPANASWETVIAYFKNCKIYKTKKETILPFFDFIKYLRHKDASDKLLTQEEVRIVKQYYKYLKFCSECESVYCSWCDKLIEKMEEAEEMVRKKRFSFE
ncbi:MAG: hypothetical protein R2828_07650 [Saprospiraceae bacterium]